MRLLRPSLALVCQSFITSTAYPSHHNHIYTGSLTSLRTEQTESKRETVGHGQVVGAPHRKVDQNGLIQTSTSQDVHFFLLRAALDSVDAVSEESIGASSMLFGYPKPTSQEMAMLDVDFSSIAIYMAACLAMAIFVTGIIYPLGVAIVCQTLVYVSCLAFIKMSLKVVFALGYNYPKFITALHLTVTSTVAFSVLFYRRHTSGKPVAIPNRSEMLYGILPIACAFGFSIAFENTALLFVSASFAEVLAASTPVASAYLTYVMGMAFNLRLLRPIFVVVAGCVISVQGEMDFSCIGCILLLLSVFCRSFKAVLQQKFMTTTAPEKFDPVTMTAWTCCFASLIVATYSMVREGRDPIYALAKLPNAFALVAALLFSCLVASLLNIAGLFLVKGLGAVGMQIVGQVKAFLVVIGGLTILKETFTKVQMSGFALALLGVFWYSSMHRRLQQLEQRATSAQNVGLEQAAPKIK